MKKLLIILLLLTTSVSFAFNPMEHANDRFGTDKVNHFFGGMIIADMLESVFHLPKGERIFMEQIIFISKECVDLFLGGRFDFGDILAGNAGVATRAYAINTLGEWELNRRVSEGLPIDKKSNAIRMIEGAPDWKARTIL